MMEKVVLNPGTLLSPVPAVMVSCGRDDEKNILTIAWTGIVNSQPPMTYISVRKSRHSHSIISREREFVINLTTEKTAFAADWCGVKSGADFDKFKEMKLTPIECQEVSCPMIGESPINLECKVKEIHEFPTHDMFIAEIVKIHVDKELMEDSGRLAADKAGLVAYVHGEYFGLKKSPIGRFGFSVMKKKTKKRISKENHQKWRAANQRRRRK
ncbi:MAG: flavin reductase family protein [Anaerovoracaceae bacterium]|nr:flavin reductase family protein [Anaerovoracaceae bacterium]